MMPPVLVAPIPLDQAMAELKAHAREHPMNPLQPPDNWDAARHVLLNGVEYRILFDRVPLRRQNALLLSISAVRRPECECVRPSEEEVAPIREALGMQDAGVMPSVLLNNSLKFSKFVDL